MLIHLFPCLLGATAIASFLMYQRTNHDIYGVLAVTSFFVCLIWGIVVAHWLIHLLLLIIILKFTTGPINLFKATETEGSYVLVTKNPRES